MYYKKHELVNARPWDETVAVRRLIINREGRHISAAAVVEVKVPEKKLIDTRIPASWYKIRKKSNCPSHSRIK